MDVALYELQTVLEAIVYTNPMALSIIACLLSICLGFIYERRGFSGFILCFSIIVGWIIGGSMGMYLFILWTNENI